MTALRYGRPASCAASTGSPAPDGKAASSSARRHACAAGCARTQKKALQSATAVVSEPASIAVTAFVMITGKGVCISGLGTSSSLGMRQYKGTDGAGEETCEVVEEVVCNGAFL